MKKEVTKEVTREEFQNSMVEARKIFEKHGKSNKPSYWCGKFNTFNEKIGNEHDKEQKAIMSSVLDNLEDVKLDLCMVAEKDIEVGGTLKYVKGAIIYNEKSEYCFTPTNQKKLNKAINKANEELSEKVKEFLAKSITINICEFVLSEEEVSSLEPKTLMILEGLVFKVEGDNNPK